jgi:hypothetical protein
VIIKGRFHGHALIINEAAIGQGELKAPDPNEGLDVDALGGGDQSVLDSKTTNVQEGRRASKGKGKLLA